MNNTKSILLVAIITATLVMGTSVIPMQSYASGERKKNGDSESSVKVNTEVDKKSASQHQDQDNFCYRGDDCQQANEGQQIVGKDNEAKGFNDQSGNFPPITSGTVTGEGTGDGNGGGTNTNPVTNNFITNNNVTVNVDNSICDEIATPQSSAPQPVTITVDLNPVNSSNTSSSIDISDSFNNLSASASSSTSQSCTFTLNNSTFNQGTGLAVSTNPTILPNPTGAPCTTPLVNAVLTIANPLRSLDLCVNL